jgi:hypothetical protein
MHKTVQLTCFTQVFYVTAFGFVGCISFSFLFKFGLVLVLGIHEIVQAIESECDLKEGHMAHGWHMDGTWMGRFQGIPRLPPCSHGAPIVCRAGLQHAKAGPGDSGSHQR